MYALSTGFTGCESVPGQSGRLSMPRVTRAVLRNTKNRGGRVLERLGNLEPVRQEFAKIRAACRFVSGTRLHFHVLVLEQSAPIAPQVLTFLARSPFLPLLTPPSRISVEFSANKCTAAGIVINGSTKPTGPQVFFLPERYIHFQGCSTCNRLCYKQKDPQVQKKVGESQSRSGDGV